MAKSTNNSETKDKQKDMCIKKIDKR